MRWFDSSVIEAFDPVWSNCCKRGVLSNVWYAVTVLEMQNIRWWGQIERNITHRLVNPGVVYRARCSISTAQRKTIPVTDPPPVARTQRVEENKGTISLAVSGQQLQLFQKGHETGLASSCGRDPDICRTVVGRVSVGFGACLLVGSQFQRIRTRWWGRRGFGRSG